jgi:uncharacterized protein
VNGSLDERLAQASAVALCRRGDPDGRRGCTGCRGGRLQRVRVRPARSQILEGAGLTNLTNTLPEDERYSFIFQGNSQSLDHILVSDALAGGAQFDAVHVNAEFAVTPQRASDHDPLVAGVTITPPQLGTETVTVAFNEVGQGNAATTVADITIGDLTVREVLGVLTSQETLDFAGVTLESQGPGLDLLVADKGALGISSRGERPANQKVINSDELLIIDLGGDADRFLGDFKQVRGVVELSFYDDGELVAQGDYALSGGVIEFDTGLVFDEVHLTSAERGRKLSLEGFEFDRVIETDDFIFA